MVTLNVVNILGHAPHSLLNKKNVNRLKSQKLQFMLKMFYVDKKVSARLKYQRLFIIYFIIILFFCSLLLPIENEGNLKTRLKNI